MANSINSFWINGNNHIHITIVTRAIRDKITHHLPPSAVLHRFVKWHGSIIVCWLQNLLSFSLLLSRSFRVCFVVVIKIPDNVSERSNESSLWHVIGTSYTIDATPKSIVTHHDRKKKKKKKLKVSI